MAVKLTTHHEPIHGAKEKHDVAGHIGWISSKRQWAILRATSIRVWQFIGA